MIGEIRDGETAGIAVQSAITGHLVVSTLHTNSSAASVSRLVNMGIEPYLLTPALQLIIGQRLVRRICPHC
jgi:type IV pilus assembly protein PilB